MLLLVSSVKLTYSMDHDLGEKSLGKKKEGNRKNIASEPQRFNDVELNTLRLRNGKSYETLVRKKLVKKNSVKFLLDEDIKDSPALQHPILKIQNPITNTQEENTGLKQGNERNTSLDFLMTNKRSLEKNTDGYIVKNFSNNKIFIVNNDSGSACSDGDCTKRCEDYFRKQRLHEEEPSLDNYEQEPSLDNYEQELSLDRSKQEIKSQSNVKEFVIEFIKKICCRKK